MKAFTIENDTNNISIHASAKEADAIPDSERFGNEAALAKLAANWPTARLIEIWNSLPGANPVAKFKDRTTAVSRIWKAIQCLEQTESAPVAGQLSTASQTDQTEASIPDSTEPAPAMSVAPQTPHVAPQEAPAMKKSTLAKTTPAAATKKGSRKGSKTETILALMKQPGGTTLKALMAATNWQAHSVRGFISGTLKKKMGLTVVPIRAQDGERSYSINS
jgi:hypothetical protein